MSKDEGSPISTRLSTFPPPPLQLHILDGFSTASLDLTDSRLLSSSPSVCALALGT
jgi:hypothetical protein